MGKRKGSLEETLSYCIHKEDPRFFMVSYRDKNLVRTESLSDFITKEEFADIPISRIVQIKGKEVIWEKGQKQVNLKKSNHALKVHCLKQGLKLQELH